MKICSKCQQEKPVTDFYQYMKRGKLVYHAQCKKCRIAAQLDRQKNDPRYKLTHRRAILKHRYGVSPEWYEEQLERQEGHCAICPATEPGGRGEFFSVDHDHKCCPPGTKGCGECARGLLCLRCNNALGWYEANFEAIASYLSR